MVFKSAFFESIRGRTEYWDHHPNERHPRIVLPVRFGDQIRPTLCILDTGAPVCILEPEKAAPLGLKLEDALQSYELNIRGNTYFGHVHRITITLEALEGQPLSTDATVFVPELEHWQSYSFPNFLGLQGFLERIRFAVDPVTNSFYFGGTDVSG